MAGTGTTKEYVFGVKIFLQKVATQDSSIGLFEKTFGNTGNRYDVVPVGSTTDYTYDGTGLPAPLFVTNGMVTGGAINISGFDEAGNNGSFTIVTVTETQIIVNNPNGVIEADKIGVTIRSAFEFRWINTALANTSETWFEGFLVKNGIGNITQTGDFRLGGNLTQYKGLNVTVTNAPSTTTQFWKKLEDSKISLNGLRTEIVNFDNSTNPVTETIVFRGIAEIPSGWTKTRFTIPVLSAYYKRKANLSTIIDNDSANGNRKDANDNVNGQIIPCTFGEFKSQSRAKFIRTKDKETIFNTSDEFDITVMDPIGRTQFPVVNPPKNLGESDTSIKIDNPGTGTDIWDYIYQGTGTNPLFTRLKAGDIITINSGNFASNNNGTFTIDVAGALIFSITRSVGTEQTKTLGSNEAFKIVSHRKTIAIKMWDTLIDQTPVDTFLTGGGLDDFKVRIVRGQGTSVGILRNIDTSVAPVIVIRDIGFGSTEATLEFTLEDFFPDTPFLGLDDADSDQAYIEFVKLESNYEADVWPCNDFIKTDGTSTTTPEVSIFDERREVQLPEADVEGKTVVVKSRDPRFVRTPEQAFVIATIGDNTKSIETDPTEFNKSNDELETFTAIPIDTTTFKEFNEANLARLGLSNHIKQTIGFYVNTFGALSDIPEDKRTYTFADVSPASVPTGTNTGDRLDTSITRQRVVIDKDFIIAQSFPTSFDVAIVSQFRLSAQPTDFEFDTVYLGINADLEFNDESLIAGPSPTQTTTMVIQLRTQALGIKHGRVVNPTDTINNIVNLRNLPDWYYSPALTTSNQDFYTVTPVADGKVKIINGFTSFELNVTPESYETNRNIVLGLQYVMTYNGVTLVQDSSFDITSRELAVIFRRALSIKNDVFIFYKGRIFDDTWADSGGARKTAANLITSPLEVLEHILRLQNWHDIGSSADPGKEYAINAIIDTSSNEGGFAFAELSAIADALPARQIVSYSEAWSDTMIKSICQQFHLASFQRETGEERVNYIGKNETTPTIVVDLNDIIRGSIGDVVEAPSKDIFCEPFVRFNFNHANGKFDNVIRVTNASANEFDASFVTGYNGTEAEEIWDRAHALFLHYRVIEEPPTEWTDLTWIDETVDAVDYLLRMLEYMGAYRVEGEADIKVTPLRRITFAVPYDTATQINATFQPWFVSQHFRLKLPHETGDVNIQCMIESITFDLNKMQARISAVMFTVDEILALFIKDSFDSFSGVGWEDWKDADTTKSEVPSQDYDIKDST